MFCSRSHCDLGVHRTVTIIELQDTIIRYNISKFEDPRFKTFQVIVLSDTHTQTCEFTQKNGSLLKVQCTTEQTLGALVRHYSFVTYCIYPFPWQ
jgi:hypothetical protein